jgi:hypothetical protein
MAPTRRALPIGLAAALALGFAGKLAVALWALDRGFELGDEGYSLLNLNHPADAPVVHQIYRLLAPLGGADGFGVVGARWLRIVAEAIGSLALIAGVLAWARARVFEAGHAPARAFVPFCLLGALLGTGSRSLTYNDLTNLCTYAAIGALFWLASAPPGDAGDRRRTLAALAAGLCNGLQLGVKFPTALALLGLAALAGAVGLAPRDRLRVGALYAAGLLLAVALYVLAAGGVAPLVAEIRVMPEVARSTGYDPLRLVGFYSRGEAVTAIHVVGVAAVFGASLALLRSLLRGASDASLAGAFACGALALVAGVHVLHPFFLHPTLVYLSALLAFSVALLAVLALRRAPRPRALAPLLLLLAVPLVEIAGTNVPISERLPTHALPIFAALGVLSLDLRERAGARRLHAAIAVALLAATSALFVQHHVRAPYGLPSDIASQIEPVAGLPGVRVDAATRSFLESVAGGMREAGFEPGDPVLALDFMPGLVFFLRGTSPGFTLFVFDNPRLNCLNVNRLYRAPPFLILGRPMSRAQAACLRAFAFPDDFRKVRSVRFPYEAVYADFGAVDFTHVHLYAPRDREPGR